MNKDRITMPSNNATTDLRIYYKAWKLKEYLFEGASGEKYSGSSVAAIINRAAKKHASIKR